MQDKSEALRRLDDTRLMDVVKNYRQYGYDEAIRNTALSILDERGIAIEQLALSGNLHNASYDNAQRLYSSYVRNSNLAFLSYLGILFLNIALPLLVEPRSGSWWPVLVIVGALAIYLRFLIGAFMDQSNFFKSHGKRWDGSDQIVYFLIGMPLYVLMFFYYRNRMKEEMKSIR